MERELSTARFGLLANGSSGPWCIDLDESLDGHEWLLQIESPRICVTLGIGDLAKINEVLSFLRSPRPFAALCVGQFDSSNISMQWDDEGCERCCFILGPNDRSMLRIGLTLEDTVHLAHAFAQVAEGIPQPA